MLSRSERQVTRAEDLKFLFTFPNLTYFVKFNMS